MAVRYPEGRTGSLEYSASGKGRNGLSKRQGLEFQNPFLKAGWAKGDWVGEAEGGDGNEEVHLQSPLALRM